MASTIFTNISLIANTREDTTIVRGKELARLPCVQDAYIVIEDDIIAEYGVMANCKYDSSQSLKVTNNCIVLPCWCDSHTHLVFSGSREDEFVDKIKGLNYADIAARGGGILKSAKKLNLASEDQLFNESWKRLEEVSMQGTGAIEIKSGYGLTLEGELKMLRVNPKATGKKPAKENKVAAPREPTLSGGI